MSLTAGAYETYGDFEYEDRFDGRWIVRYNGYDETVTVPAVIDGQTVAGIDDCVFFYNSVIKSVTIGEGIPYIGSKAFQNCTELTDVSFPDSLTTIGGYAFDGCTKLQSVTFPQNIFIGNRAFRSCESLTTLTLPQGASLDEGCFQFCKGLTRVELPSDLKTIPGHAFQQCTALQEISFPGSLQNMYAWAFQGCTGLKSVIIPGGVSYLGDHAFQSCTGLTEATVSEGVQTIGSGAFAACFNLQTVRLPSTVTTIRMNAFMSCTGLTSLELPERLGQIGDYAFQYAGLTAISIPDSVINIGSYAFWECTELASCDLPASLTSLGDFAFAYCAELQELTLPQELTTIGEGTFMFSGLTSITLPSKVTVLAGDTFHACASLTEVILPTGLTSIGTGAFSECAALERLALPEALQTIEPDAFTGTAISEMIIPAGTSFSWAGEGVTSFPEDVTLLVTEGSPAHLYAEQYHIEFIYINEGKASVTVYDENGSLLSTGYLVEWFEKDTGMVAGVGRAIFGIDDDKDYYYAVILDEAMSYQYKQPERQDALIYGQINKYRITLEPLGQITVSGRLLDQEDNPVVGARVTFTQSYNQTYTKTITAVTDSNGIYTARGANVPTSLSVAAEGYYPYSRTLIEHEAPEEVLTVDDLLLKKLPKSKIRLTLSGIPAVAEGQTAKPQTIESFNGLTFTLYNLTTNTDIPELLAAYPDIIPDDSAVHIGDELRLTVTDTTGRYPSAQAEFTIDEQKTGACTLNLTENGKFRINSVSGEQDSTVLIFRSNGRLVSTGFVDNGYLSDPMAPGSYQVVLIRSSILLRSVMSLSKLEELGLTAGEDFVLLPVTITNGTVSVTDSVTVPSLDEKKLYYTVDGSTRFTASESRTCVGKYVVLRCEYEIDSKHASSHETLSFELSDNLTYTENSLSVNGQRSICSVDGNTVTVAVNQPKGVVRFYVYAADEGDCFTNAYLSMEVSGQSVLQPLGTANFYAEKSSLSVPERTSQRKVTVSGNTLPDSQIILYLNGKEAGRTETKYTGKWKYDLILDDTDNYAEHEIYYTATEHRSGKTLTSDVQTVIFDHTYIELSKIIMINTATREFVTEFDFINPDSAVPSYDYWSRYPTFTFKVEFIGDDQILEDVSVVTENSMGQLLYIPVKYDKATGLWVGKYDFTDYTRLPVNISAVYHLKSNTKTVSGTSGSADVEAVDLSYVPVVSPEFVQKPEGGASMEVYGIDRSTGSSGNVTLGINGSLLSPDMTAVLKMGDTELPAADIYWINHTFVYAVFHTNGAPDGVYSLAVEAGTGSAVLNDCFTLNKSENTGSPEIQLHIADSIKTGEEYQGSLTVTNTGSSDIYAPVLSLNGENLLVNVNGWYEDSTAVFVPNTEGLAGIIRKGETAHINFTYQSVEDGDYSLSVTSVSSTNALPIDRIKLTEESSVEDIIRYNYAKINGTTNLGFQERIAKAACFNDSLRLNSFDLVSLSINNTYQIAGNLGFSVLEAFTDIETTSLSFSRTYYGAIADRFKNGTMGYGWSDDGDISAEYAETEKHEGIIITSPTDQMVFLKEEDTFKCPTASDLTASVEEGEIVLSYSDGGSIRFGENGRLSLITDQSGNRTIYAYNADGQLQSVSNSFGEKLSFGYLNGRLSEITSSNGDRVVYSYENDYLTSVTTKYGTVKYVYDTDSIGAVRHSLVRIEYPNGAFKQYSYDTFGRVTGIEDNETRTDYAYGVHNDILVTDQDHRTYHYYFDESGDIIRTVDSTGMVTDAIETENTTSVNIGLYDTAEYHYDDNGNLTRVTDTDGETLTMGYDENGAMTSLTDKGGSTTLYNRNEDGSLTDIVFADNSSIEYSYDEQGKVVSVTDQSSATAQYDYDVKNRISRISYSTGDVIEYTYNSRDDVTSVTINGEKTSMRYDDRGEAAEIAFPNGKSIRYAYDETGRLISVTDSDGHLTGYTYDMFDRLIAVSDSDGTVVTRYEYNTDGSLACQRNANGTYVQYVYEDGGLRELNTMKEDGTVISSLGYDYDDSGYISRITDNSGTASYTYDRSGQLVKSVSPDGTMTEYAYDKSGNRTSVKVNGTETLYTANALNQYTAVGQDVLTYDAKGNLTGFGGRESYEYDYLNRLTRYTAADGTVFEYTYDAFGSRNSVSINGEKTEYLVSPTGDGEIIEEYGAGGTKQYLQGLGLAAQISDSGTYYYHYNHLGSTTNITDQAGNTVNRYSYDAEGRVTGRTETIANPFTYVGQYGIMDDQNGLYYMRARYTSQHTGSFITPDPAGQYYDTNLYRYANNNPVNFVDLTGFFWKQTVSMMKNGTTMVKGTTNSVRNLKKSGDKAGLFADISTNVKKGFEEASEIVKATAVWLKAQWDEFFETLRREKKIKEDTERALKAAEETTNGKKFSGISCFAAPTAVITYSQLLEMQEEGRQKRLKEDGFSDFQLWVSNNQEMLSYVTFGAELLTSLYGPIDIAYTIYDIYHNYNEYKGMIKELIDAINELMEELDDSDEPGPDEPGPDEPGPGDPDDNKPKPRPTHWRPARFVVDPSGYVYEAVPSNRLEGVKVEAYYHGYAVDEFGIPDEQKSDILWDAENYDQVNPLYTDANGCYYWDVPQGQWLVKYSKEGYYDTDSRNDPAADSEGYLPVPPPQTEVNTAMVSKAAPRVESVKTYREEVLITFSQYMQLDSVNVATVTVKKNGTPVGGTISPVNGEYDYEQVHQYASEFRFVPEGELEGTITVIVDKAVNYAGTSMTYRAAVSHIVEAKAESIVIADDVKVPYSSAQTVEVQILPQNAGANKALTVISSSPSVVRVVSEHLMTDRSGKAYMTLIGSLPGNAELTVTLDGTELNRTVTVVVDEVQETADECERVTSDIESYSVVEKGTQLSLTTDTEDAEIYYTVDGSSPEDEENPARLRYTVPIVIDRNMTVTAYVVKDGFHDSKVAAFSYEVVKAPALQGSISITGHHAPGDTLTAALELTSGDPDSIGCQWYADDIAVGEGGSTSYTLTEDDIEKELKFVVTPTTEAYSGELSGAVFVEAGHIYELTGETPATCTEDGKKDYQCSACGHQKTEILKAAGHRYSEKVIAPTAEAQGYTLHICSVCGHSYQDSYTDKLLVNRTTVADESILLGTAVSFSASATGGSGVYQYAAYYKKQTASKWLEAQAYSDNADIRITPAATVPYDIIVMVKDERNTVVRKTFRIQVT